MPPSDSPAPTPTPSVGKVVPLAGSGQVCGFYKLAAVRHPAVSGTLQSPVPVIESLLTLTTSIVDRRHFTGADYYVNGDLYY